MAVVSIVGTIVAIRYAIQTPLGRRTWDALKLKIPVLGMTVLKMEMARFARTLGTLLASSVPLIAGVRIVQDKLSAQICGYIIRRRLALEAPTSIAHCVQLVLEFIGRELSRPHAELPIEEELFYNGYFALGYD